MSGLFWHPFATYHFAISGVETWLWLPSLAAFTISFFTSMAGISGAFLLVPFQMSMLGFASPSASATNLVFNLMAIPGGMVRYWRENRLFWPLALVITAGGAPDNRLILHHPECCARTVENLLAYGRPVRLQAETVDLNVACADMVRRWQGLYPDAALHYAAAAYPVTAEVDVYQLERVLDNLLDNARQA